MIISYIYAIIHPNIYCISVMLLIFRKQLHLLQLMQLTTFIHILYAVKEPKCKVAIYKYQETLLKTFKFNIVDNIYFNDMLDVK